MRENNMLNVSTKINSHNQITIPKAIQDALQISAADEVQFTVNPNTNQVTIAKVAPDLWQTVYQQEKKYGSVDTPEIDWGIDIESKDF